MAKTEETSKHTLHLRAGDYARLKALFPEVGAAFVIRKLVSNFIDRDQKSINITAEELDV